jgi:hypothetical protein
MLHQTLPGVPEAVSDARAWTRTAVLARYPHIDAEAAAEIAGELVAAAVRHTPANEVVKLQLMERRPGELIIQVRDPNKPGIDPHTEGRWDEVSRVVRDFGAYSNSDGHTAWCELPATRSA